MTCARRGRTAFTNASAVASAAAAGRGMRGDGLSRVARTRASSVGAPKCRRRRSFSPEAALPPPHRLTSPTAYLHPTTQDCDDHLTPPRADAADGECEAQSSASTLKDTIGALYRLYLGIADGTSTARVWARRNSKSDRLGVPVLKMTTSERRSF